MRDPVDVPTAETLEWLCGVLGREPTRILEVGCGDGEVAAALAREGHEVLAVDGDADCVARARARGVNACQANFPDLEPMIMGGSMGGLFGAVLFTRVMHHLKGLPSACATAESLLRPRGLVLIEDFAWEEMDEPTAAWAYGLLRLGRELEITPEGEWDWDSPPLVSWRARHMARPRLHTGKAILGALAEVFDIESTGSAPYAYRWLARYMRADPRGFAATRALLEAERDLIRIGSIVPIGMRVIGRVRASSKGSRKKLFFREPQTADGDILP